MPLLQSADLNQNTKRALVSNSVPTVGSVNEFSNEVQFTVLFEMQELNYKTVLNDFEQLIWFFAFLAS